ncbi:MAG: proteasome subunit alpha [Cellulomonadaceae bacterium]|jgi:proteasome alpha subunit|nr:proteasome subunit alpha [Cellulomonadaceae bacterium]
MNMPVYVSPEQLMKDRADFARKGVARGRPVIVMQYDNGILFVTENVSRSLHKIAEIYDRIGFAAVGKYNEFEKLRVTGVRYADMRGYAYDRSDVAARGLANAYAQMLGSSFTTDPKPMEVEIVVAEVGATPDEDQIYRLSYDGSVADEPGFVVMGANAEFLRDHLSNSFDPAATLDNALITAIETLRIGAPESHATGSHATEPHTPAAQGKSTGTQQEADTHEILPRNLEIAVLERDRVRRKFRRLVGAALPSVVTDALSGHHGAPEPDNAPEVAVSSAEPGPDQPAAEGNVEADSGSP